MCNSFSPQERENFISLLRLAVSLGTAKDSKLVSLIHKLPPPGIIITIDEEEALYLVEYLQHITKIQCTVATVGLLPEDNQKNRELFNSSKAAVMILDQPSSEMPISIPIRSIIHYSLPQSIKEYIGSFQLFTHTIGELFSVILYDPADRYIQEELIKRRWNSERENLQQFQQALIELNEMEEYAVCSACRMNFLYNTVGWVFNREECGICDNCRKRSVNQLLIHTTFVKTTLRCVAETREKFGVTVLTDVLRGITSKRVKENNLHCASTFGKLKSESISTVKKVFDTLLQEGMLRRTMGTYPTLYLTGIGKKLMQGEMFFPLELPKRMKLKDNEYIDRALMERMRNYRRAQAKLLNVPAFKVFSDSVLKEIVLKCPHTKEELFGISGFGEQKWLLFGEGILRIIRSYQADTSKGAE